MKSSPRNRFRNPLWIAAGAAAILAGVVGVRAALFRSRQLVVDSVAAPAVDVQAAALHLSQVIRFETISHESAAEDDAAPFAYLHAYLRQAYPRLHAEIEPEKVGTASLLYVWKGEQPELAPVVLMAHQDVVPIEPGTEGKWTHGPFAGIVDGGYVWGRGAMDDKGALVAILESVEKLVSSGFRPKRTIYLAFGHDEEVGGERGAKAIAELLKARGVRPLFVLDEGGAIVRGILPGVGVPLATVGIAEKGSASVPLEVEVEGGHSSMPPRHTAIGILSQALVRLEDHPVAGGIRGPFREMLETVGREMPYSRRLVLGNLWLFAPLVERRLAAIPAADTMMRTSTAVTIVEGGVKANVLPSKARAVVNFRIAPGDTVASVVDHVRRVVGDPRVRILEPRDAREPSPIAGTDSEGFRRIERTIRELDSDVVVAPYLLPGGTDSRHFAALTADLYRFAALPVTNEDLPRAHGTDERVAVEALARMVAFYERLISTL
jgi:carboxypeptidase PM20D1